MLNIDLLDASWIKAAVKKATELNLNKTTIKSTKPRKAIELKRDKKVYFGGRNNFFKLVSFKLTFSPIILFLTER